MTQKPFEVRHGKVVISCETAQGAADVAKLLGSDSIYSEPWRVDEFLDFVGRIQVQQRRLLAVLIKPESSYISDSELRHRLRVETNQGLAGVLSGLTKIANAMGIDPKRVYAQDVKYKQGLPQRRYWVNPTFRQAAENADWPSERDLEDSDDE